VAHAHVSIVSPAAIGGALEAERRAIPSVVTFHSVVPRTDLLARAMRATLRSDLWHARFTAVSGRVAREVQPAAGSQSISLLPNGIDAAFWRSPPKITLSRRDDTFEMVSVMRLNPKKRPLALVEIVRRLGQQLGSGLPIRLRVVGDGPERDALARAVRRNGLGRHIELLGACSREEIRALLAAADVFLLPTIRESFGLAALEARCAGLPVVAMAQSGVAELVEHGREGLLGLSDSDLAMHLATLATNGALRGEIADHNQVASTPYDWPRVISAHESVYREAIALRANVRAEMYA
jgi:glycosyltransferase involved in cell wall biosynthesis